MSERYIRLVLCDGCNQCVQIMGNQQIKQEHVLQQEDVTNQVKGFIRRKTAAIEVQDVEVKQ